MKTILEIDLPEKAKVLSARGGKIRVEIPHYPTVGQSRALWVKTFDPEGGLQ